MVSLSCRLSCIHRLSPTFDFSQMRFVYLFQQSLIHQSYFSNVLLPTLILSSKYRRLRERDSSDGIRYNKSVHKSKKFVSFFSPKVSEVMAHAKFKVAFLLDTVLKHFANEGLSFRPSRRGNKRLV
jgi:hypothetical protein